MKSSFSNLYFIMNNSHLNNSGRISPLGRKLSPLLGILVFAFVSILSPLFAQDKEPAKEESTKLEILPYLQNPTPDAMTVCFLSTDATDVKVEFIAKKGSPAKTLRAKELKIPKTNWKIWKARLTGLNPKTSYSYRVSYTENGEKKNSETYSFQTLDWNARETKAIAFNDIHDKIDVIEALLAHVKPNDYQFTLLMGDMWDNPSASKNAERVFKTMESYVRLLNASSKPMFYLRGNHDTRGNFSGQISYLFDLPNNNPEDDFPNQNAYFEFRYGPVWFISPDAGEDGNKREEIFTVYRERQVPWLTKLFANSPSRKATWKVIAIHIPLFTPRGWDQPDALKRWAPVLDKANIDLMIAGHDHTPHFVDKGKTFARKQDQSPQTPPYPVLIGGGPNMKGGEIGTVMLIKANSKNLNVRMIDVNGKMIKTVNLMK